MSWIAAGVAVVGAGTAIYKGVHESNMAKAAAKRNVRPLYQMPKEWFDNVNLAGGMAEYGLTAPAQSYYTKQSERGLQSSLDAILKAGGNVNNVSQLFDNYDTGAEKIAAEDSQLKGQNIMNLIKSKADLANEFDKQWTLNYYEPYKDNAKAISAQKAAADQTTWNGINSLANTAAAVSTASLYKKDQGNKTMGEKTNSPVLPNATGTSSFSKVSTQPADNPFATYGKQSAFKQVLDDNPNSPYYQDLMDRYNLNE